MANPGIFCFIKFGKKQHMNALLNLGQLHFTPLEDFKNSIEKERGDNFEGAFKIINDQFVKIECDHPELGKITFKPVENTMGRLIQYNTPGICTYSILAITTESFPTDLEFKLDPRLQVFGDHAVFVKDPTKFVNLVKAKLSAENREFACKLIEYTDYSRRGEIVTSYFNKDISFKHQAEYRFVVKQKEAFNINIGSINEFAAMSTSVDMINMTVKAKRNSKAF
jgi:hypothetical protein